MQLFYRTIYRFDAPDSSNSKKNKGHVQPVHENIVSVFFFLPFYQKELQSTSSFMTNDSLWQPKSTENKAGGCF